MGGVSNSRLTMYVGKLLCAWPIHPSKEAGWSHPDPVEALYIFLVSSVLFVLSLACSRWETINSNLEGSGQ